MSRFSFYYCLLVLLISICNNKQHQDIERWDIWKKEYYLQFWQWCWYCAVVRWKKHTKRQPPPDMDVTEDDTTGNPAKEPEIPEIEPAGLYLCMWLRPWIQKTDMPNGVKMLLCCNCWYTYTKITGCIRRTRLNAKIIMARALHEPLRIILIS